MIRDSAFRGWIRCGSWSTGRVSAVKPAAQLRADSEAMEEGDRKKRTFRKSAFGLQVKRKKQGEETGREREKSRAASPRGCDGSESVMS